MNVGESEILRKLHLLEWLKAELVVNVGGVFHAIAQNSEQAMCRVLAKTVINCYVLGRRLGIDFNRVDDAIIEEVSYNIKKENEVETWFGDYSELKRYLRQQR